jgi:alpha-tubulin suppressor-like RCC1 family protein
MHISQFRKLIVMVISASGMLGCRNPAAPVNLAEPLVAISAGGQTTCAISASGAVLCWGRGTDGQLGNAASASSSVPVQVQGGPKFSSIEVGFYHTCALTAAGEAYCWGATGRAQNAGQLGNGSTARGADQPVRVETGVRFVSVSAGQLHTCGLTKEGTVHCWGDNHWGQLGDGTTSIRTTPVAIASNHRFVDLAAGDAHTCAITDDGRVLCWGDNFSYAVTGGAHTPDVCADGFDQRCTLQPSPVAIPEPVQHVRAGGETCATTASSVTYCWGGNLQIVRPVRQTSTSLSRVELGTGHGCGFDADATVKCWGAHRLGQLGSGSAPDDYSETPVLVAGGLRFNDVSLGMFHTCGVTVEGAAYCWGANREGQLGIGNDTGPAQCGLTHPCSTVPILVRTRKEHAG